MLLVLPPLHVLCTMNRCHYLTVPCKCWPTATQASCSRFFLLTNLQRHSKEWQQQLQESQPVGKPCPMIQYTACGLKVLCCPLTFAIVALLASVKPAACLHPLVLQTHVKHTATMQDMIACRSYLVAEIIAACLLVVQRVRHCGAARARVIPPVNKWKHVADATQVCRHTMHCTRQNCT